MARLFVQFMHPGPEPWYGKDESGICEWNTTKHHRRKCIRADVLCWDPTRNVETGPKEMYFWGEWEAPTDFRVLSESSRGYPKAVHRIKPPPMDTQTRQNTDPFVIGDAFVYTMCQQPFQPLLRELDEGSIIAFGSRLRDPENCYYFGLDTLFVVGNRSVPLDLASKSWRILLCNELYETVTVSPLKEPDLYSKRGCSDIRNRTYLASMLSQRNGKEMFSFVPCKSEPFQRPFLRLLENDKSDPGLMRPKQTQGINTTGIATPEEACTLWWRIIEDLEDQGVTFATHVINQL